MIKIFTTDDHKSLTDGLNLLFNNDQSIQIIGSANSGKEILSQFRKNVPDILITDVQMPEMNGAQLCSRVKKQFPEVKVIAYSMFDNKQAVRELVLAGVDGYILKSRSLDEVRQAIKQVYRGFRYFDPSIVQYTKVKAPGTVIRLSKSEREILKLIAQHKTSSEIAELRFTAVSTVQKHRKNIIQKLGLCGSNKLLEYAVKEYGYLA